MQCAAPPPLSAILQSREDPEAEEDQHDSLEAYFAACAASSSTASSALSEASSAPISPATAPAVPHPSSSLSTPSPSTATVSDSHGRKGAGRLSPLQGSASRPLLLRQRQFSQVIPNERGVPPPSNAPLSDVELLVPPPLLPCAGNGQCSTAEEAAPRRGAAGQDLARQLQHSAIPLASQSAFDAQDDLRNATRAFDFHLPPPAASFVHNCKTQSPTSTVIVTAHGKPSRSPSTIRSVTPCLPAHTAAMTAAARQRAVLFDVLCALRQHPTATCQGEREEGGRDRADTVGTRKDSTNNDSAAVTWKLRATVLAEAQAEAWPDGFCAILEALLVIANEVATLLSHVQQLEHATDSASASSPSSPASVFSSSPAVQEATASLEAAGRLSLLRLGAVVRQLLADFMRWVLETQEYLLVVCTESRLPSDTVATADAFARQRSSRLSEGGLYPHPSVADMPKKRNNATDARSTFAKDDGASARFGSGYEVLPPPCSLLDLVAAVQENIVPLQRCRVLVEESGCLDGLSPAVRNAPSRFSNEEERPPALPVKEVAPPSSYAVLAARLLDTLIIEASALQDTSTMDLYRFYVMLLLFTAWPYVLLSTAVIFGFVRGIDPPLWRRRLPRLFRSSFSHVRIGDAHRQYPTDVLSLMLNCVGYYNAQEVLGDSKRERPVSLPRHPQQREPGGSVNSTFEAGRVSWQPVNEQQQLGAAHGSRRSHHNTSEHHVALAALTSARTFVLRSLASFTRRKRQVALSRTATQPTARSRDGTNASPTVAAKPLKKPKQEAEIRDEASGSWQPWHKKSIKEILHHILHESASGGGGGSAASQPEAGVEESESDYQADREGQKETRVLQAQEAPAGAAVLTYAQQNQDVRRRILTVPADVSAAALALHNTSLTSTGADAGAHFRYYPTTIPLGFAAMTQEALEGQREDAWRRWKAAEEKEVQERNVSLSPPTARVRATRTLAKSVPGSDNDSGDPFGMSHNLFSLWTLVVVESGTTPDVRFANAGASAEERHLEYDEDANKTSSHTQQMKHRRQHQLWINTTIPCARWVTTALLIPIGVAVQRLQEQRLRELFAMSVRAVRDVSLLSRPEGGNASETGKGGGGGVRDGAGVLWREDGADDEHTESGHVTSNQYRNTMATTAHPGGLSIGIDSSSSSAACSFLHALKLLIDVALLRDQERLVSGFLGRLYREPRWWSRRWVDGGAEAYARGGTAAPTVSFLFAEALRGKRFGDVVRLVVLPATNVRRERASVHPHPSSLLSEDEQEHPTAMTARAAAAPAASTIAGDMLDMFASFQLEFTLPGSFALILQPRDLSVYLQPTTNTIEHSYQTFFWQRRRRLYVGERSGRAAPAAVPSSPPPHGQGLPAEGLGFADVWSYVFGYQCSLYYAQLTLREHQKQLRDRDAHDFEATHIMGMPGRQAARHLQYVSRGLGSASYTLHFAVDTLLSFMQGEAMKAVYHLERLLGKATRGSPGLMHSCMEFCYEFDGLLLQLHGIAFPGRRTVSWNEREALMQTQASDTVRQAVQRILEVALDPSRMPVSYVGSTTRNAVEALVAAVTASSESDAGLAARLHPLRVLLTFNKYYGSDQEILSYRFR